MQFPATNFLLPALKGKQEKLKIPGGKTKIKMGIDYEI